MTAVVDEIAVERCVNRDGITWHQLTKDERVQVVRVLNGRDWSDREIAQQVGCAPETVMRMRARHRIPPVQRFRARARWAS